MTEYHVDGTSDEIKELREENERLNIALTDSVVRDVEMMQLESRVEELEARVKLADILINGTDCHVGMVHCLDGYYVDVFINNLKKWDRLMENEDE